MKFFAPDRSRAVIGLAALILITAGAGIQWGVGGAFLTLGLVVFIDVYSDEALERATNTKRGFPPAKIEHSP